MITFKQNGDFSKTSKFLNKVVDKTHLKNLEAYGEKGVKALSNNVPIDSGKTASSWYYKIKSTKGQTTISWYNSNVVDGVPIAIILQYGHGTKNGGYVQGRDYINPAIKPIFDEISNQVWKEVNAL